MRKAPTNGKMFKSFCVMNKSFPYDLYIMYTRTAVDSPARRFQEKGEKKTLLRIHYTKHDENEKQQKTKKKKKEKIEIMSVMNECKKRKKQNQVCVLC